MKIKLSMFAFFALLCNMMFFKVVEDEGSGGGDDIGDDDIDPGDDEGAASAGSSEGSSTEDEYIQVSKSDWERVTSFVDNQESKDFYSTTIDSIKEEYPDFDDKVVLAELKAMHKKDPAKAKQYNNEGGFIAIWNRLQKNAAKNDDVNDGGSKGGGAESFDELMEASRRGDRGAKTKLLDKSL